MSRPACQHGVPLIFDCFDCDADIRADEYLAEAYSDHTPGLEHWERAGVVKLAEAIEREAPRARDAGLSIAELAAALEVKPDELRAELRWRLGAPGVTA